MVLTRNMAIKGFSWNVSVLLTAWETITFCVIYIIIMDMVNQAGSTSHVYTLAQNCENPKNIYIKQLIGGAFSSSCHGHDGTTSTLPCQPVLFSTFSVYQGIGWKLAEDQLLLTAFPLDREHKTFVRTVRNALFSEVKPTPFSTAPQLAVISVNSLVNILDMDPKIASTPEFLKTFSGCSILEGSTPLAHRYGGHQFGYWAGQLGDGRAHLLGEYVNRKGQRWELQLKGSGKTPYSRNGDGRAVIRSSVREFLCSEAMYHLGIPTSRTASLVISDDKIWRDQFYDGHPLKERTAVVLRLAPSWFRIGSFEILAKEGEILELKTLADFVIQQYFPRVDSADPNKYLAFYSEVVEATAEMVAKWQSIGFAHGVCNTDNFSILSITIDYGPFGFMDEYDPSMTPNTSDDEKQYTYEKQPDVARFNLEKLRVALEALLTSSQKIQMDYILAGYNDIYKSKFMEIFCRKLGLTNRKEDDEHLVASLLKMMEDTGADFTMTFRQLGDWQIVAMETRYLDPTLWSVNKLANHDLFWEWTKLYVERLRNLEISEQDRVNLMHSVNPRYILRNWMAQTAIAAAERNDFSGVNLLLQILSNPFQEQEEAEHLKYADPPPEWAKNLKVSCSS